MDKFAAMQQTSTAKLPVFLLKVKERALPLKVNETKADPENASN